MSDMKPVTFLNKEGFKLFGIVHHPGENERKDRGIIILSPGIKSRVAPHRLYVKMSRLLSQMGFVVLRFDYYGLGDSEGEIDEEYVADFYGSVQCGRYIDDTVSAMDWVEKEYNISNFILMGLCGGAITGLLTATKDLRVDALLGLGIPAILDGSKVDHSKYITEGQLKSLKKRYINKLFCYDAWFRFFSFKSDYRIIFKSFVNSLITKYIRQRPLTSSNDLLGKKGENRSGDNFNPHLPKALNSMVIDRKLILIFSERDRLYWEFQEKMLKPYKEIFEKHKSNIEIHVTKDANHIFTFQNWQEDMLKVSKEWLEKNCCGRQLHTNKELTQVGN